MDGGPEMEVVRPGFLLGCGTVTKMTNEMKFKGDGTYTVLSDELGSANEHMLCILYDFGCFGQRKLETRLRWG